MYIIINKTRQSKIVHKGSWPGNYLEKMLDKGDKVIVISHYSNTIKVPYSVECNGIKEWEWEDYPFAPYPKLEDRMRAQGFIPISELDLDDL